MNRVALMSVAALAIGAASISAQASKSTVSRIVPAVTRVRMTQAGTVYKFEPANLTVHPGDVVEFVNVSGFPHNVQFEPAKIPAGAAAVLNHSLTNLSGPMMLTLNQTLRVSFAGAPAGTYEYFCLPHKAMGMKGVITVAAAGPARR